MARRWPEEGRGPALTVSHQNRPEGAASPSLSEYLSEIPRLDYNLVERTIASPIFVYIRPHDRTLERRAH